MPPYVAEDVTTGALRHFDAPNNRAVLLHLAAERFRVSVVKFETIGEREPAPPAPAPDPDAERDPPPEREAEFHVEQPAPRRGRPRKNTAPEPAAAPSATEPATEATNQPSPAAEPLAQSEALIQAEAARVDGGGKPKTLFERMSTLAAANSPASADPPVAGAKEGAAHVSDAAPENAPAEGLETADQQGGADQQKEEAAPSEDKAVA